MRDLYVPGDRISGVVMWSEVFARCDDPSVAVRWSDPSATTIDGDVVHPDRVSTNYQTHVDGGCANTDSSPDGAGARLRCRGWIVSVSARMTARSMQFCSSRTLPGQR